MAAVDYRQPVLEGMFPEYEIQPILESMTTASVEQIADWVLNNVDRVPRKRKAQKRKHESENDDASASDSDLEFDDIADNLLLDRLVKELLNKLKRELSLQNNINGGARNETRHLIAAIFPGLRMEFIKFAFQETGYRICATLIASFFISNKLTQKLRDFMQNPQSVMWIHVDILGSKRKKKVINVFDPLSYDFSLAETRQELDKFAAIMYELTAKYPNILNRIKLLPEAFTLRLEIPEDIPKFNCGVCFDEFTINQRFMCGTGQETDATQARHSFCRGCIRQQAQAATEEMPLAEGGIGLKCMEFDCKNAILYSVVRSLIPKNIRKRIDERIMEENLGNSGLNLERCRECNFAIEMAESKEENKVFACPNCEKNWCRLCERSWDGDHFGISCAELDEKNQVDKRQRELERRLNEAVIRKCRCGLQFTKSDGCNKMTCRCGATQCYICRQININYSHFCQHVRNPGQQCNQCKGKTCTLWEDARQLDKLEMDRIRAEVGLPAEAEQPGPSRPRLQPPLPPHFPLEPPHLIPQHRAPHVQPPNRQHHFNLYAPVNAFGFNMVQAPVFNGNLFMNFDQPEVQHWHGPNGLLGLENERQRRITETARRNEQAQRRLAEAVHRNEQDQRRIAAQRLDQAERERRFEERIQMLRERKGGLDEQVNAFDDYQRGLAQRMDLQQLTAALERPALQIPRRRRRRQENPVVQVNQAIRQPKLEPQVNLFEDVAHAFNFEGYNDDQNQLFHLPRNLLSPTPQEALPAFIEPYPPHAREMFIQLPMATAVAIPQDPIIFQQEAIVAEHPFDMNAQPNDIVVDNILDDSSDSSISDIEDQPPLEFDENNDEDAGEVIDLTQEREKTEEELRAEEDVIRLHRISARGECYEVMPVETDSFIDATRQFAADIAFSNRIINDLKASANHLRESWNAGDKNRDVEKNQRIAHILAAAENLFNAHDAILPEFEQAKNELDNNTE